MQRQLPLFPSTVKLFNPHVGVYKCEGFVYYLHDDLPLYCHEVNDNYTYRYVTAQLVCTKLCSPSEIARVLGVSARNIQLYAKALREKGHDWFLHREETRGKCYKFTEEKFAEAQKQLDSGKLTSKIAEELGVSDSAMRYHIYKGKLKKN